MDFNCTIPCPNCGNAAHRRYVSCKTNDSLQQSDRIIQTECPTCDYFLAMCSVNGKVIEAHSSSTWAKTRKIMAERSKPLKVFSLDTLSA